MNHSEIFLNKYEQNVVEDILTLKPGTDEYGKYWSWIARNETGFRHNGNTVRDFELRIYGKDLWRVLLMNREVIDFLATNNHDNWYHVN